LPCCQCTKPIDQVSKERSFADVWASQKYGDFRAAARALPAPSDRLQTCECDRCQLRPRNLAIHNFLHPLNRLPAGEAVQKFTLGDVARKIQGVHGRRPWYCAAAHRSSEERGPAGVSTPEMALFSGLSSVLRDAGQPS